MHSVGGSAVSRIINADDAIVARIHAFFDHLVYAAQK